MWNCEQVRNYYADKVILSQLLILHRHSNDPGSTWLAAVHTYRPTTVTSESSKLPLPQKWKNKQRIFWQSWCIMKLDINPEKLDGVLRSLRRVGCEVISRRGHLHPTPPQMLKVRSWIFVAKYATLQWSSQSLLLKFVEYSLITKYTHIVKKNQNMLHKNPCYAK